MTLLLSLALAQDTYDYELTELPLRTVRAGAGFSGIEFPYSFATVFLNSDVLVPNVVYVRARGGMGVNFAASGATFYEKAVVRSGEVWLGWPLARGTEVWPETVTLDYSVTETTEEITHSATVLPVEVTATNYLVPQVGMKVYSGGPIDRLTTTDGDPTVLHGYLGVQRIKRYRSHVQVADGPEEMVYGEVRQGFYVVVGEGGRIPAFNSDNPHYKGGNPWPVGVYLEQTNMAGVGGRFQYTRGLGFVPTQGVVFRYDLEWYPAGAR